MTTGIDVSDSVSSKVTKSEKETASSISRHNGGIMVNERLLDTPFDQYQRYRATEEIIRIIKKETGKKRLRILDVGGYFKNSQGQDTLPLKEFLPEEDIFVLDMVECHLPHYIQGDATATPFPQKTFDVLVCQDVLEHIPPKDRETFLKNLLQLVKSFVVLGAPFKTENTVLAEKILYEYIWRTLKGRHRELEEHIQNGLPDTKDMESFLKGKRLSYCDFPSGYLNNWLLLMMVKHYLLELPDSQDLLALIDRFYNKNFYESDQRPPAYRHMFVISKTEKDLHILEKISGKFRHYREKYKHLTLEKSDFSHLQTLLSLDALRDRNTIEGLNSQILNHRKHIQQLEERIKNQILNHHKHAQQLEKAIKNQEVHIQNYKEEVLSLIHI